MSAEETPTRRSTRAPATSKKYGQDFLTDKETSSQNDTPSNSRSKPMAAATPPKVAAGMSHASEDTIAGREMRRTSKRVAKDGNIQPEESVVKKSKRDTPKVTESDGSKDTQRETRSSRRDPAAARSMSVASGVEAKAEVPSSTKEKPSTATDAPPIDSAAAPRETREGGAGSELPSPAQEESPTATNAQPNTAATRSKNTRGVTSKVASPDRNLSTTKEKSPAGTIVPPVGVGESEHLVWQPIAMLPSTATIPMKEDAPTKMIEVNVRAEEAKKLSSKGPVNITPASEIYRALKAALESQKSKNPGVMGKTQSVQIALRVSTHKQPCKTTKQPSTATKQPSTTTKQPSTATKQPTKATKQPTTATQQPGTKQPSTTTKQPSLAVTRPTNRVTKQPSVATNQLNTATRQSNTTPKQPVLNTRGSGPVGVHAAGSHPRKRAIARSPGARAAPRTRLQVDVIRPEQAKHLPVGELAQSSQMTLTTPGESSPVSILSASPYRSTPGPQQPTGATVPLAKKRLRTVPTQTSEEDIQLCIKVNKNTILTGYKVINVTKESVNRATLRTTVIPKSVIKKGLKRCQTEMEFSGLEMMILDRLQEGEEEGVDTKDRCSLQLIGDSDGEVDRRIQSMLFGQDLDMAMTKSQGGVLSNVIEDPSDKDTLKPPNAKVSIESWSLALAGAMVK